MSCDHGTPRRQTCSSMLWSRKDTMFDILEVGRPFFCYPNNLYPLLPLKSKMHVMIIKASYWKKQFFFLSFRHGHFLLIFVSLHHLCLSLWVSPSQNKQEKISKSATSFSVVQSKLGQQTQLLMSTCLEDSYKGSPKRLLSACLVQTKITCDSLWQTNCSKQEVIQDIEKGHLRKDLWLG